MTTTTIIIWIILPLTGLDHYLSDVFYMIFMMVLCKEHVHTTLSTGTFGKHFHDGFSDYVQARGEGDLTSSFYTTHITF